YPPDPLFAWRVEPLVAFLGEAIDLLLQQILEHLDDADFAPRIALDQRMTAVQRGFVGPRIEAAVAGGGGPRARVGGRREGGCGSRASSGSSSSRKSITARIEAERL